MALSKTAEPSRELLLPIPVLQSQASVDHGPRTMATSVLPGSASRDKDHVYQLALKR